MLPETITTKSSWQTALSNLITDPEELLTLLELDPALLQRARAAAHVFPLKVPRGYVARMRKRDMHDPLLQQVLPLGIELDVKSGYTTDPLKEADANPVPGLLHKYHGRVLVTLTSACAVHCRYCFRRHFPYAENNPGTAGWEKIIAYIHAHPEIHEVILSGGDPLAVSDKLLAQFTQKLSAISHVSRLRIHTRLPIVLPERVTDEFIHLLTNMPWDVAIVVHANHAQEIDDDVVAALTRLKQAGVMLLNQSVLLRGINDDEEVLVTLSERLFSAGVLPYYLHVLDKVEGAAHFDLPLDRARALHAALTGRLSGYLVPRLVCEQPGADAKISVSQVVSHLPNELSTESVDKTR